MPAPGPASSASDPTTDGASVTSVHIDAEPRTVWSVVSDPRTYPLWLVGAQRIRSVDSTWPEPGSGFHHTVGWAPLRIRDRTEVVSVDPHRRLALRAHISVMGSAAITIDLEPAGPGTTVVTISEEPWSGLISRVWRLGGRRLVQVGLWGRNAQSLERLKEGIEGEVIVGEASTADETRESGR